MKDSIMKRGSTWFLRLSLIAFGIVVLILCIFAVPAISAGIALEVPKAAYMYYPFLIAMYASAFVFYMALYQAFKLLQYIDTNAAFSELSVQALRHIQHCAVVIAIFLATLLPLFFNFAQSDDAPGVMAIGLALVGIPSVVAVVAMTLRTLLRNAIDLKKENELTV